MNNLNKVTTETTRDPEPDTIEAGCSGWAGYRCRTHDALWCDGDPACLEVMHAVATGPRVEVYPAATDERGGVR